MAQVHLTFDDGPSAAATPTVLERLAARGARATFFVLGEAVCREPGLLAEIAGAGHRIELHGDQHLDHRRCTLQELADDTARALGTLAEHQVRPVWWRLPWGRPGPATATLAKHHGLRVIGWDVDTHDWRGDGVKEQPSAPQPHSSNPVVLLHDGFGPGATRTAIANTLALIDHFAAAAAARGDQLTTLPDPCDAGRLTPQIVGAPGDRHVLARLGAGDEEPRS